MHPAGLNLEQRRKSEKALRNQLWYIRNHERISAEAKQPEKRAAKSAYMKLWHAKRVLRQSRQLSSSPP